MYPICRRMLRNVKSRDREPRDARWRMRRHVKSRDPIVYANVKSRDRELRDARWRMRRGRFMTWHWQKAKSVELSFAMDNYNGG
jgi:hypothetical protein